MKMIAAVGLLATVAVVAGHILALEPGQWPNRYRDPGNASSTEIDLYEGLDPMTTPLRILWDARDPRQGHLPSWSPLVHCFRDNRGQWVQLVIVGSAALGRLLDAWTGVALDVPGFPTFGRPAARPDDIWYAIDAETDVFVTVQDGDGVPHQVVAYDLKAKAPLPWTRQVRQPDLVIDRVLLVKAKNGVVYLVGRHSLGDACAAGVVALDEASGDLKWQILLPEFSFLVDHPAIGRPNGATDDWLYLAFNRDTSRARPGGLIAISGDPDNPGGAKRRWVWNPGTTRLMPPGFDDTAGSVYVSIRTKDSNGRLAFVLHARDAKTGAAKWSAPVDYDVRPIALGRVGRSPAAFAVGRRNVCAFNRPDGTLLWQWNVASVPTDTDLSRRSTFAGGRLYVEADNTKYHRLAQGRGETFVLDAADGRLIDTISTEGVGAGGIDEYAGRVIVKVVAPDGCERAVMYYQKIGPRRADERSVAAVSVVGANPPVEVGQINVQASPQHIDTTSTSTVTAIYRFGLPGNLRLLAGVPLEFSCDAADDQGHIEPAGRPTVVMTDANGQAKVTFVSGKRDGAVTVLVSARYAEDATTAVNVVAARGPESPSAPSTQVAPAPRPAQPSPYEAWTRGGITTKTLANGLVIVLKEVHATPAAALHIYVRSGPMYEQQHLGSGISHLLEHLVDGGSTSTRSRAEIQRSLDGIGARRSAHTLFDHTCYSACVPAANLPTLIDVMADWMRNANLSPATFLLERLSVACERDRRCKDSEIVFREACLQNEFRVFPISHSVIGYSELCAEITRDDVLRYYRARYTPNNVIVAAAGDFDTGETLALIERAFADWKRQSAVVPASPREPPQVKRRFLEIAQPVSQAKMSMCFHTVPWSHPDAPSLDLISFILSVGERSRLVRRLRDVVGSVQTGFTGPACDTGQFTILTDLPYANIRQVEQAVVEELDRLKMEPIPPSELAWAKKQKAAEDAFDLQTVDQQAAALGLNALRTGDPLFNETYDAAIQRVGPEDLMRVAQRYFRPANLSVTVMRPQGQPSATATRPAESAEATIRRVVLPNGLVVILKRHPSPRLVAVQTVFLGGVRSETEETNGISQLTAQMLDKGTQTRTAQEIAAFFSSIAGTIGGSGGQSTFSFKTETLSEDFEKAFEVYVDCLLKPTFPPAEFETLRRRALAEIAESHKDPFQQAERAFRRALFVRQPFRMDPGGARASLERLTPEALAAHYRKWGVANRAVMAIFGDIHLDQAEAVARRLLARMPADPDFAPPPRIVDPPLTKDERAVAATDHPQCSVILGYRGMDLRDTEDRFAADVLKTILDGRSTHGGWLQEALRQKRLADDAEAVNWTELDPGFFAVATMCEPAKVDEVIATMSGVLNRAKTAVIPDAELKRLKQSMIADRVLLDQTNASLALAAATNELYGLGYDFDRRYLDGVKAVTAADVRRVAAKYLTHSLVVVTQPLGAPPSARSTSGPAPPDPFATRTRGTARP